MKKKVKIMANRFFIGLILLLTIISTIGIFLIMEGHIIGWLLLLLPVFFMASVVLRFQRWRRGAR